MFKLIKKDLTLMFSNNMQKILMLILGPMFLIIIEADHMDWLYLLILISYSYVLIITPFSFDTTNKTISLINSIPIKRKEIVVYRYLSVFVYILISIIYVAVYMWIIDKTGLINIEYFNLSMIKIAIPYIMVLASIMFPTNFRFEPGLSQIINTFIYSATIIFLFNLAEPSKDMSSNMFFKLLTNSNFIILAIIVYMLSMVLSIRLYENRDL